MEVIKNETEWTPKIESKLIVIVGVEEISKQFLKEAIIQILHLSGYTVNAQEFDKPEETEFHVVDAKDFDIEIEAKAHLVFSSYRNPVEVIEYEHLLDPESKDKTNINTMLNRFVELAKWMRSSKLAYTLDYNAPSNVKGLHNFNVLNQIINPLVFTFQRNAKAGMEKLPEGRKLFTDLKPIDLISSLVPDLAKKSQEASEKFETIKKEKTEDAGSEQ